MHFLTDSYASTKLTLKRPGGIKWTPPPTIGFSNQKFEAFKQSKWNFQYLAVVWSWAHFWR